MSTTADTLAIHGGQPIRQQKMPPRLAFDTGEIASVMAAMEYYRERDQDPPYQGHFEEKFCEAFADYMGGGFADAVSTGTAACYVALAALQLPKGTEVIISPVTDSGPLNCIIALGLIPVVADAAPGSYNIDVEQFIERITPNTSGLFAVHCAGEPLDTDRLVAEAHKRNIKVLEDCSQAPGAVSNGRKVGLSGDIAAFSTMYRKSLATGGSGGLVYSTDLETYRLALGYADRGKQPWRNDLNQNDPGNSLFPALNFNTNELSCAVGLASIGRLQDTINKRVALVSSVVRLLQSESHACTPYAFHDGFSPFFFPIFVDTDKLSCSKIDFADALAAEGIELNRHYGCVISGWEWAKPYLSDNFVCTNALDTKDRTFNLHLNEQYGEEEAQDIIAAILKVEKHFS